MPPIVVAGAAAAATIGGSILAGKAQKKAAGKAADAAQDTAAMNNALQEKIYGSNVGYLSPYVNRGNEAGNAINALLGISGTNPAAGVGAQPGTQGFPTPVGGPIPLGGGVDPMINDYALQVMTGKPISIPVQYSQAVMQQVQALQNQQLQQNYAQTAPATTPATGTTPGQTPYQNAFQNYLNSTGYQFQVDQGNKQITQGYAAKGALQSGSALQALQTYGQNTATGFFKDYLGLLGNQQGVGLSGASAIAGVGQNYANSVSANNNNAGSAAANAYLAQGNANANMWGGIGGAVGGLANAFGSSYKPGY